MDIYLVYVFDEADGENKIGPNIYVMLAANKEEAMYYIWKRFPLEYENIRLKRLDLMTGELRHIGTMFREPDNDID